MGLADGAVADAPPGGWDRFVEHSWTRRAERFAGAAPIADAAEIFALLVAAAANPTRHWRLFVDAAHHQQRLDGLLPTVGDGDFDGFMARAARAFPGAAAITLLLHEAQFHRFDLYRRIIHFLDGLYRRVGDCIVAEATVYVSRANRTCFGIHKDEYANFLFQLQGRKRFLLWPEELLREHPELIETSDPGPIRDRAIVLDAHPGDLLYFPAHVYHLAEADEGVSVHFSLLLDLLDAEVHQLVAAEAIALARRRVPAVHAPMIARSGEPLPPSLAECVRSFDHLGDELARAVEAAWARRRSAHGFRFVADALDAEPFAPDERVAVDPVAPILHARAGDALTLFAHGHALPFPAHPNVLALVERLNRGAPCVVRELLAAHAGRARVGEVEYSIDARGIGALLRQLRSLRAIDVVR